MKRTIIATIGIFCLIVAAAFAHTSRGTLVCVNPSSSTPQFQASITGDSFPGGHHVSVSLKVVDNGVTITNGVVVSDSSNGNQTFGPFTVNRQGAPETPANATATFTIHDKSENIDYVGTGGFEGKCGQKPPPPVCVPPDTLVGGKCVTPPPPPIPPVPPVVPPAPPVPPVVPPVPPKPPVVPKCAHIIKHGKKYIVCKPRHHKRTIHKCRGGAQRLHLVDSKGRHYTACVKPHPHFTG